MECPYCGAELDYNGPFGRLAYFQDGHVAGHMYLCPNHEGFNDKDLTEDYVQSQEFPSLDAYMNDHGLDTWEDISCDSCCHHVSGSFYTYESENETILHEGYPC